MFGVLSLGPTCTLEISDLDYLANTEELREATKWDYSDMDNCSEPNSSLRGNNDRVNHLQDKAKGNWNPLI